jgi:tetratricopeptide (TPR) repeat protein
VMSCDGRQTAFRLYKQLSRLQMSAAGLSGKLWPWGQDIYPWLKESTFMKAAISIILVLAMMLLAPAACQSTQNYSDQAYSYFLSGNYEQAATTYDLAIQIEPNSTALWNYKGRALAMLQRFDEAIYCFDRSMAINPNDPESMNLKAIALSQGLKMDDQAILLFDRILQMNSSYYDAWNGKGMALANQGDMAGALQCFENAILIRPQDPQAWNNKGVILLKTQRYQEALDCFNQALSIDPNNEAALQNKGSTQQEMKEPPTIRLGKGAISI